MIYRFLIWGDGHACILSYDVSTHESLRYEKVENSKNGKGRGFGSFATRNFVFSLGGIEPIDNRLIERFDMAIFGKISFYIRKLPIKTTRQLTIYIATCVFFAKIALFLQIREKKWEVVDIKLPKPMEFFCAFEYKGMVHCMGGEDEGPEYPVDDYFKIELERLLPERYKRLAKGALTIYCNWLRLCGFHNMEGESIGRIVLKYTGSLW